jgi:hypothetical protein
MLASTAFSWCLAAPSWAADPSISVQLTPSTIVADGSSTTTAVATIPGASTGGDTVTFNSSDPNETVSSTTDNQDGTYSATITSSTTVGQVTITASDSSNPPGQATLNQVAGPATSITVALQPNSIVADGVSQTTATATVTDAQGHPIAGEPMSITSSDPGDHVGSIIDNGDGTYTALITSSTSAHTAHITATDGTISSARDLSETSPPTSTPATPSGPATPALIQDTTSTTVRASSAAVKVNAQATYTAVVTPSHTGGLVPSGTVSFLEGGHQIAGCSAQPLASTGAGTSTASCTVSYARQGSHTVTAVYGGDANFTGSSSAPSAVKVQLLGRLGATMRWIFVSGASYTKVLSMLVRGAPSGSQVLVTCHGGGCPFAKSTLVVPTAKQCLTKSKSCSVTRAVDLSGRFAKRRLRPGARITVEIVEAGWIGRSYTFVVRAHRPPRTASGCVAGGSSAPVAC